MALQHTYHNEHDNELRSEEQKKENKYGSRHSAVDGKWCLDSTSVGKCFNNKVQKKELSTCSVSVFFSTAKYSSSLVLAVWCHEEVENVTQKSNTARTFCTRIQENWTRVGFGAFWNLNNSLFYARIFSSINWRRPWVHHPLSLFAIEIKTKIAFTWLFACRASSSRWNVIHSCIHFRPLRMTGVRIVCMFPSFNK